jgi:undecaprenyl-diphosphatase
MIDKILSLDTRLFIYLNSLGTENWDQFWLQLTKQISWTPLFLLLLYVIYKKNGMKGSLLLVLFVAVLLLFTDQTTNIIKNNVQRLRPCSEPTISSLIRIVKPSATFSFFSGHAANSIAVSSFLYLILRRNITYIWLLFLWPLLFAYSRIYLGLHYPLDIICGYLYGMLTGFLFFNLYLFAQKKI